MNRMMKFCLALYAPHLLEEALTRMVDDPIIVLAFGAFAHLSSRQAAYLVFQIMLVVSLAMTYLFSLGGRWRSAVMILLAVALLGESHHILRWLVSHQYNSGLVSSLPMPVLGALILRAIFRDAPAPTPATAE
jgi:hypothetical protein